MRNIWNVARRELGAIFVQPIAYIFAIAIVGITGFIFGSQIAQMVQAPGFAPVDVSQALQLYIFLLLFVSPAITMRLISEEQRSGTLELLMTLPIRDGEVVIGKWLAAFIFYLATTALTLIYPFILIRFGNPDLGVLWTSYLATILAGAALLGIGILASAMTQSQIVAFFISFFIILLLYLAVIPGQFFQLNQTLSTIFDELSFNNHLNQLFSGLVVVKDVLYFVGLTAVSLFAATRILESRRWR